MRIAVQVDGFDDALRRLERFGQDVEKRQVRSLRAETIFRYGRRRRKTGQFQTQSALILAPERKRLGGRSLFIMAMLQRTAVSYGETRLLFGLIGLNAWQSTRLS